MNISCYDDLNYESLNNNSYSIRIHYNAGYYNDRDEFVIADVDGYGGNVQNDSCNFHPVIRNGLTLL